MMARRDASIPDWPAMMSRTTAARYCDMSPAEFEREIVAARLPVPCKRGDGERWARRDIDEAIERMRSGSVPDWRAGSKLHAQG
jgi:hypothetical protein